MATDAGKLSEADRMEEVSLSRVEDFHIPCTIATVSHHLSHCETKAADSLDSKARVKAQIFCTGARSLFEDAL